MQYNCRYCKAVHDTCESSLRCKCGADLEESMKIGFDLWMEEQRDLAAGKGPYTIVDSRKVSLENRTPCPVCGRPTGGCCTVMIR